jgi:outer membrane protein TolC
MPDPTLTAAYTNEGLDSLTLGSTPDASLAFTWTQDLPYPGKRRLAGEVARAEVTTAEQQIEAARVRVRSAVKRLYFDLHRIDRSAEILEETRKVLASFVESARARYESGEGALENVLKAQTEVLAIEVEVEMNRQERRATEAMLVSSLGRRTDATFGRAQRLPPIVAPDRTALDERAASISPELRVLQAMADTEARRLDLSRRNLKPDLMYGAGYSSRGGLDPMVMGMVGIRLPLYRGRKQAQAVAATESLLEAARRDVERGRIELAAQVRELFTRLDSAGALAHLYADGLIPQARSTLDAASGSYAAGQTDFLALLDDALKLLRYEIELERQRVDALQALVGLEELTGADLIAPASGGLNE